VSRTRAARYVIRRRHRGLEDLLVEAEVRPDPAGGPFLWTLWVNGGVWTEDVDADRAQDALLLLWSCRGVPRRTVARCWDALVGRTR